MITVVRIIDRLNVGGPAIHAAITSGGLDRTRFRTILVHGQLAAGEEDMSDLLPADVERIVIPSLGRELRPLSDLRTAFVLYRLLRRVRPDIVHTHKAKAGAVGRVAALLARVPVRVHTFHGHVLRGYFGPARSRAFVWIERALARTTSRIVALSDGLVDELADEFRIAARHRFTVVPLGFDLAPHADADRHRGTLRRELGVSASVKLIGIVGRMVPVKDHATFIEAMARLAARRPEVQAVFIGGGEGVAAMRARAAERLPGRAHFLGWRRDLPVVLADLDVVALSSVNEGTPVALIEAMAAGVPVASTAVGGVPDVLGHGARGELAPSRDPEALAAAIERALEPSARERANAIRASIVEKYGGARLCRDLEALYETLLSPNASHDRP